MHYVRTGQFAVHAPTIDIFPLLCPKREEEWIPGWECKVIFSNSGYNEENAIFLTDKPYGTELYWHTMTYNFASGKVDFLITASHLYAFRFTIDVYSPAPDKSILTFTQRFTSVSEGGISLIEQYRQEDFQARLQTLGELMSHHLHARNRR
jgi:hypothetical protein